MLMPWKKLGWLLCGAVMATQAEAMSFADLAKSFHNATPLQQVPTEFDNHKFSCTNVYQEQGQEFHFDHEAGIFRASLMRWPFGPYGMTIFRLHSTGTELEAIHPKFSPVTLRQLSADEFIAMTRAGNGYSICVRVD